MGQRTGILLQVEKLNGEKKTTMHYCQWGIGKVMPFTFIKMLMEDYLSNYKETDKWDAFKEVKVENGVMRDITDEFCKPTCEEEIDGDKCLLDKCDATNIKDVKKVFDCLDNNNGGFVLIAKEKKDGNYSVNLDWTIGFLLGSEETCEYKDDEWIETEEPFSRFVPLEEWAKKVGGEYMAYSPHTVDGTKINFTDIFTALLKFMGGNNSLTVQNYKIMLFQANN